MKTKSLRLFKKFLNKTALEMFKSWDAWVAQSVKCLTLDFGSGPDLMVPEIILVYGSALMVWSLLEIFSLSLILPTPLNTLFLTL